MGSGLGLTIESPGFDVAAGEVQKPGDVPAIVINELKSTIRGMPEKKKYSGKPAPAATEEVKKAVVKHDKKNKKKDKKHKKH